jgi:hypothetical protein
MNEQRCVRGPTNGSLQLEPRDVYANSTIGEVKKFYELKPNIIEPTSKHLESRIGITNLILVYDLIGNETISTYRGVFSIRIKTRASTTDKLI